MIFIDSHVHVRGGFDVTRFLDHALANFRAASAAAGTKVDPAGVLVLTETRNDIPFAALAQAATAPAGSATAGWSFRSTSEDCSLVATRGDASLVLIASRQIRTREGLEVHFLGTGRPFPDGRPIDELLAAGEAAGLEQVIPWAPGKWLGHGAALRRILDSRPPRTVHLGDIGTRPAWWPTPGPFRRASSIGHRILRGSDPGPFAREVERVGSFGFTLDGSFDPGRPAAELARLLRDPEVRLEPFGRPCSTVWFAITELRMALTKRERTRHLSRAR